MIPKMIQFFDDHFYKVESEEGEVRYLPSVTTKLQSAPKAFLARWRGDVGNAEADRRMNAAGEKGTRIHYACSLYLNGGAIIFNPFNHPNFTPQEIQEAQTKFGKNLFILQDQDEMWQVAKFVKWMEVTGAECILHDEIVYDLEKDEAGTLDFVFRIPEGSYEINGSKPMDLVGGNYVADLKTGNQVADEHFMQIAAYWEMVQPRLVDPIVGGLVLHTNADLKKGIPGMATKLRTPEEKDGDYQAFRHVAAIWERQSSMKPRMLELPAIITKNLALLGEEKKGV
jgi:hypothetical protein